MNKSKKQICIHGHFYQPPRENAWLEIVELQDSATPFHNWNARITAECYAPNAAARILNQEGYISDIVNNYAKISFNFGPTLLSWMEKAEPDTYQAIIEADRQSCLNFNGHGSAIAQVYNHLIMPLANMRDKHAQVIWGIRDFEHRFGRAPKGMWLAETAVDLETLEVLVDHGIEFTILAPRQAKAIRFHRDHDWETLNHADIDPKRPYKCLLKNGRSITLFFYDGHVAQKVAFDGLLNDGKAFAKHLINTLDDRDTPQMAHIATDGESYGHHHRKGEMALADCLDYISKEEGVELCNYASFLADHPVSWEVDIHENSSWSCVHGVERWRNDCGCQAGGHDGWTQAWRKPLRVTLDWLRDQLIALFEREAGLFVKAPWAARNDYIRIVLDRSNECWQQFLDRHCLRVLEKEEACQLRQLLEMQRQSMLMFSSCGWFFDEVSGLETNQILQYAQRAISYAESLTGQDLHTEFIDRLRQIPSNVYENAANSYQQFVEPARVNMSKIAMHFAVARLYELSEKQADLFYCKAISKYYEKLPKGNSCLIMGRMHIQSSITLVEQSFSYVIWQHSDHFVGLLSEQTEADFFVMRDAVKTAFTADPEFTVEVMQQYFDAETFGFDDLRQDSKHKLLEYLSRPHLKTIRQTFRDVYEREYELMSRIRDSSMPLPTLFQDTIQAVLNEDLNHLFQEETIDLGRLQNLAAAFIKWDCTAGANPAFQHLIERRMFALQAAIQPTMAHLKKLQHLLSVFEQLAVLQIDFKQTKNQNLCYTRYLNMRKNPAIVNQEVWQKAIGRLGEVLKIRADQHFEP